MLFHVNTILTDLISGVSMCNVQIEIMLLIKSMCHTNWCYIVTEILANKIVITTFSLVLCYGSQYFIFCMYHVQTNYISSWKF